MAMGQIARIISRPDSLPLLAASFEPEEKMRMLLEFLQWLEQTQGLVLCQAYKPKYDWYTPSGACTRDLASAFLGKQESDSLD